MGDELINSTGLDAAIADIRLDISKLDIGTTGAIVQAVMTVATKSPVDLPDADVIYIEHPNVNAYVLITAALSKKPHVLVMLGKPNTVNVSGVGGQSIKGDVSGGGFTFASGADVAAVSRILMPDPVSDVWRVI